MGCHCGDSRGIDHLQEITLKVAGMSCNHCKKAVEDALRMLNGVEDVQVDLDAALVTVKYNPIEVGLPELQVAIREAGYEVR
jgi:copper chaperone